MRYFFASTIFALALPLWATPITTFESTGVDATAYRDNKYEVIATPAGPITYDPVSFAAYVTLNPVPPQFPVGVPGGWFSNDANSSWIAARPDGNQPDNIGEFEYQTQFNLTGFDPISVELQFRIWADNTITSVLLNGTATGYTIANQVNYVDPAGTVVSLSGSSYAFNPGLNTLTFKSENTSFFYQTNVAGFRLQVDKADGLSTVPEPSTTALFGTGLAFAAWAVRRKRKSA